MSPRPTPKTKRKTFKLSPKAQALRRQQGAYMGLVKDLPKAARAELRKIRVEFGYPAAIRSARNIIKSRR